jgi:hypothetical protein
MYILLRWHTVHWLVAGWKSNSTTHIAVCTGTSLACSHHTHCSWHRYQPRICTPHTLQFAQVRATPLPPHITLTAVIWLARSSCASVRIPDDTLQQVHCHWEWVNQISATLSVVRVPANAIRPGSRSDELDLIEFVCGNIREPVPERNYGADGIQQFSREMESWNACELLSTRAE